MAFVAGWYAKRLVWADWSKYRYPSGWSIATPDQLCPLRSLHIPITFSNKKYGQPKRGISTNHASDLMNFVLKGGRMLFWPLHLHILTEIRHISDHLYCFCLTWLLICTTLQLQFTQTAAEVSMMTSSNGSIFRVTGHLCGEFTGPRWIPHTKASDAELWCLLWSAPESTVE